MDQCGYSHGISNVCRSYRRLDYIEVEVIINFNVGHGMGSQGREWLGVNQIGIFPCYLILINYVNLIVFVFFGKPFIHLNVTFVSATGLVFRPS